MRKRIGIFIGDAPNEFPKRIVNTVIAEGKKLGYDVFAFGLFGSNGDNLLYAEGEKHMLHLPNLEEFDGVIVCEDTFDLENIEPEIEKILLEKAKCPVVYLRRHNDHFYNVEIYGSEPMAEMVRHFVYHHGCRDICFMQGPMIYQDARDRYEGFERVCEEVGITITPHMVFEGDFWRGKGKEAMDWFLAERNTLPEAIICANDHMAISICEECKRRGIRVPEDIMVSGCDNTYEAQSYIPSITSISVDFSELAVKAVQMIQNINEGKPQAKQEMITPQLVLLASCGCGGQKHVDDWSVVMDKLATQDNNMRQLVFMTTDFQGVYDEAEYLRSASYYFKFTKAKKGYLCLCTEQQADDTDQKRISFSDTMVLKRIFHDDMSYEVCEEAFPKDNILPEHYFFETEAEGYLILEIHHKNKAYGYMVLTFEGDNWVDGYVQPYLTCLANVIDDNEVHKQMEDLEEIRSLYQMDPLTGIYNRRGFEKQFHILNDRVKKTGEYLSIVSIDMDNLKYINDNFGHAEGDFALSHLANVLQQVINGLEICARVGGDEYNAILVAPNRDRHLKFAEQFTKALMEEEERVGKPYPIRASVGVCCVNDYQDGTLIGCLQKADEAMYRNKRARKAGRKD